LITSRKPLNTARSACSRCRHALAAASARAQPAPLSSSEPSQESGLRAPRPRSLIR
jgi:hypothetical protein